MAGLLWDRNMIVRHLKVTVLTAAICLGAVSAHAGGLAEPIEEETVAAPEVPFDPPQGSVNGGYLLLGAFALMALAAAGS